MIYNFFTQKDWLRESHGAAEFLTNVLISPIFELKNLKLECQLLDAERIGRIAVSLHLSRKFSEVFCGLSKEDKDTHLRGKEPKQWTLAFRVPTLREANHNAYRTLGKRRSSKKRPTVDRRFTKRFKNLSFVKARLLQVTLRAEYSVKPDSQKEMRIRIVRIYKIELKQMTILWCYMRWRLGQIRQTAFK